MFSISGKKVSQTIIVCLSQSQSKTCLQSARPRYGTAASAPATATVVSIVVERIRALLGVDRCDNNPSSAEEMEAYGVSSAKMRPGGEVGCGQWARS